MRRFLVLCSLILLVCTFIPATSAIADESTPSITVPIDTVVHGDPGSVHDLASVAVDASLQGRTCTVSAVVGNNDSVHPGSNLTVTSGGGSVGIPDVESSPNKVTDGDGSLVLGPELSVSLTLGADGVFSGGVQVTVTCPDPPPTTTTTPPTTTTTPHVPEQSVTVVEVPVVPVAVTPAVPVPAAPQTTG